MRDAMIKNYQLNTLVLDSILKDLKEPDSLGKTGQSNTIGWIFGHIILGRGSILNLLKIDYQKMDKEEKYKRGSIKDSNVKLDPLEGMAVFIKRGTLIEEAIQHIDEVKLNEEIGYKLPGGGDRVKDAILFTAWHETFHIGQIDLILSAVGKGGIK